MAEAVLALRVVLNDSASNGLNALGLSFLNLGSVIRDIALLQAMNLTDAQRGLGVTAILAGEAFNQLAGFVRDTVDASTQLEAEMNKVQITVNGAADAGDNLTTTLVHISDTSIFTTAQVADAFSQLGIDGWDAQQIMDGLGQTTVDFAEAAQTQTVPAALLLGSTMRMFGADASDATRYANDLTFAMYNGQKNATNLQQVIAQVGPIASIAGVNFDELAVAIAFMGQQGFVGSRAGTALRYMISGLTSPTEAAAKEMKALGLATLDSSNQIIHSAFFDAQGNFIGVAKSIDVLHKALANLDPEQQMAALKALFSVRGGQGAELFLKNYSTWINSFGDLTNIEHATSVVNKASQVTSTFAASINRIQTTWNDFMAMLGNADLGPLKMVFNGVSDLLDKFNRAPASVHTFGTVVLLALTAFTGVAAGVSGLAFVVPMLADALTAAAPVILALGAMFLQVGAAAGVIAWAFGQAQNKASQFYGIVHPIFDAVGRAFAYIKDTVMNQLVPALNKLGINMDTLKVIGVILLAVFVAPIIISLGILIGTVLVVVTVVTKLVQAVVWVRDALAQAEQTAARFILTLVGAVVGGVQRVQQTFQSAFTAIGNLFPWLYNHNYYVKALVDLIHSKIVQAQVVFQAAKTVITTVWNEIWTNTVGRAETAWNRLVGLFNAGKNRVLAPINHFKNEVMAVFKTLETLLLDAGKNLINMLIQGITSKLADLRNTVSNVAKVVAQFLGFHSPTEEGPGRDADRWAPALMSMFATGITSQTPLVQRAVSGVASVLNPNNPMYLSRGSFVGASGGMAGVGAGSGTTTVNLNVDGKVVGQVVIDRVTGTLKQNGAGRLFR